MTEQTTTPDPAPAPCGCEPDTQVSTGSTCNPCMQRIVNEQVEQHIRAEALSGLLRGMARRVGEVREESRGHEIEAAEWRRLIVEVQDERDRAEAELARVRPVVDAAREVALLDLPVRNPMEARILAALVYGVAALDGDAAATAQPADVPDIRLASDGSVWRGLGTRWVQLLSSGAHHLTPPADAVRLVRASSAPPVDVNARVRAAAHAAFTAMDKGVLMSETGDGAESALAVGHLHLIAEYLERHPDWPPAQAIVRALATPTTEETTDAR